ncbi:hypothetical protein OUZ56_024236 [Daphnia magna]|uniref:Uncharacterized protein n=1 Tax=Daphnia magna TaxID=35525 RepID=A0ABR0B0E5_9CRUS|nr:hypothetical protein OUZ56_024236 [Daphnia magna]
MAPCSNKTHQRHQLHPHFNQRPQQQNDHSYAQQQPAVQDWVQQQQQVLHSTNQVNVEGVNSWIQEWCHYEEKLRARTALLANRLQNGILNDDWRAAVDTLKSIIDFDSVNRHPPLYEWATSSWEIPYYRSCQGGHHQ